MFLIDYFEVSKPLLSIFTCLTFIFVFKYVVSTIKRVKKLPSGPWGLPFLGYLPFMKGYSYLFFDKLSKSYGPVYSLKLGQYDIVVICDWEHLKLAFADEALLARPYGTIAPGIIDEPSLIEMSGDPWRQHRRLSLHILRDIGFGKSTMEENIIKEIDQFLSTIEDQKIDFFEKVRPSVSNIISILLFGRNFDYSDPFKIEIDDNSNKVGSNLEIANLTVFLPWLVRPLSFFKKSKISIIRQWVSSIEDLIQKEINQHELKSSSQIDDYMDGYLQETKKRQASAASDINLFDMLTLKRNVVSIFGAGSETVASTLSWAMLYLIRCPEYQEKIHSEICEVIGYNRKPNYSDRNQMPFTMAYLYEVQRIGSVIATNLLRRASRDTKIGHYNIPKDTLVIFNLWSIHREAKLWPEPEKFDPNRFLIENGTRVVKPAYLVPFSGGKRNCLGEGLANVELFLYFVNILQKCRVKADIESKPSTEAVFAVARRPKYLPLLTFEKRLTIN